jgi:PAS domain S-box-containing protein
MEASLHKLVVEGAPIAQLESRIADAHGTWHTVETVAVNRLADPAVRGIIATSRDISIRKAAEAALADSEARLRLLVSNTPTILYTLDAAGTFVVCDGKGLAVFGRTSQDLVGTSSFETFRNQPGMLAAIRAALRGEEASLTGLSYGHHFEVRLAPLRDDHGCVAGVTGVALDVTELMHVQQALERSNADLEQFTSVASHDLRSPLNTIGGYAELLSLRYAGTLDAEADEFLHLIVDGVKHMQALVDDLLAFARLGASPAPAEPVECMALVERVLQQLQAAVLDSGAVVTYQNLPTLHGQKSQLRQLFQNLIDNAIKFRGKEAPRVTISAQRQDRHWLFIVADNGIGIDPAYAERIFVIFRRLHSRDDYPGTGIGLAICKKIVEGHGGRIWVESQPGQGTRFLFTLPLAPTH